MNTVAQLIHELSAAELAREVGCGPQRIIALFEAGKVPGAYRESEAGHWRCPRWAWLNYSAERAGVDPSVLFGEFFRVEVAA